MCDGWHASGAPVDVFAILLYNADPDLGNIFTIYFHLISAELNVIFENTSLPILFWPLKLTIPPYCQNRERN